MKYNSYRLSILGYIGSEELSSEYGSENNGNQGPRDAVIFLVHQIAIEF
jgi:hypothetical protein